jgi:uncharacterized protein (TIGR00297 family)
LDWWLVVALLALAGLALFAYSIRALDAWGSAASFLLGLVVALLGDLRWMLLMVAFTGLGFVATRIGYDRKAKLKVAEKAEGERGYRNVLGNGAAAGLVVLAGLLPGIPREATAVAFAAALAAVAADTLASELGVLAGRARSILPPFRGVRVGANGGWSWAGQAAALGGAALIALASVPLADVPWSLAWIPLAAGFVGCQLDSLLGATVEATPRRRGLGKQAVNFLSSAAPAALVMALLAWP